MTEIWKDLLNKDAINPDDDFFSLGGHSLLLMDLRIKIQNTIDIDVAFSDLYSNRTTNKLMHLIQETKKNDNHKIDNGNVS